MYLKNNLYLKNKEINLLLFLFLSSLLIRVPIVLFFGDISLENEWEILVNNLIEHKKLSIKNYEDVFVPNVFMPPLYVFYLYIFKIFNFSNDLYISIVLISQSLLSSFSVEKHIASG